MSFTSFLWFEKYAEKAGRWNVIVEKWTVIGGRRNIEPAVCDIDTPHYLAKPALPITFR